MTSRRTLFAALALAGATALAGCGSSSGGVATPTGESTLVVAAAASLQSAFTEIGREFQAAHDGVVVQFTFGGSSGLAAQLAEGAPADVFASADVVNMDRAVDAGLVDGAPVPFARNTLEIVTHPGNPAGIEDLASLAQPGVELAVCAPQVPCGAATAAVAAEAGVVLRPASEEQSVTDVLARVTSGEADAGLVYVTDAAAAGAGVHRVPFPEAEKAVNEYPIAVLAASAAPALAGDFVAYVTGPEGQAVLAAHGFRAP
ncbi:molybdate ABC transporter substrate-binding protein [Microbacterium album]|uniref:Molybdate-binding protein n=1 Tax=Microbacterium album TaxID=2053191 RepID=A0A917ICH5_9MICO|nr:molybdate ABC transporter substrate-binding protein [Microbacterium album]GGH34355.1 molybdate-binding protein [Microbacterium album]